MNSNNIIDYLYENELENIKELDKNNQMSVIRFNYIFDKVEIESAEIFADSESEEKKECEEWYYEYFLPYLSDIAVDNVEEIIEECADDIEMEYELIALDLTIEEHRENTFLVVFYDKKYDVDLEDYLNELL